MTILKMHVYKIVDGGEVNKNSNMNLRNYFMHGYKFLNAIFTEIKIEEREEILIWSFGMEALTWLLNFARF